MKGRKYKDISGQKFGRLTTLYKLHNCMDKRNARWLCVCDCGNLTEVTLNNLQRGHARIKYLNWTIERALEL